MMRRRRIKMKMAVLKDVIVSIKRSFNRATLVPSGKCAHIIKKSFLNRVDPKGYKWATISEEIKHFYWEEFQKKCHWDVADDGSVKTAWEHKAKQSYRQYIYNMSSRERNSTLEKPVHIEQAVWTAWNAIWNSEEFKKKSEQNKKNRRKGVEGGKAPPTHNGGSASHKQIAIDMEEYTGQAPSCFDIFMFTHTKDHDGKTLIDERSKKVHDYYVSRRADLEVIGEKVDDNDLFYRAVGGHDRKRRIYGLGSYGRSIFLANSSKECTPQDINSHSEQHQVKSKIQKMEDTIQQQQMELNEMRSTINNMRSLIEK
ncbi:hypothetical protein L1887_17818 [Cichorium endivia]|nr:hypothetical protein L1887_17818 [Cichorium endivia]